MASKIAVIGDVNGSISAVFAKLATLHAKNNFSFALMVGSLFSPNSDDEDHAADLLKLLKGDIVIPLPTYFALGRHPLPEAVKARLENDGEVCPNLFLLGRRTTIKTSEGVKIVALGGQFSAETTEVDEYTPSYSATDVKVLKGANSADILVTSDWPAGITTGSKVPLPSEVERTEQQIISDLDLLLKPRYHFSTASHFYEREPFFHPRTEDGAGYQTSRFISLAPYGNSSKQKWIYAFTLAATTDLPSTIPAGTTAAPLSLSSGPVKRKAAAPFTRFGDSTYTSSRPSKRARPPTAPSECFFCLSNPNAATHLITSIGDSAYLTTAKGPLTTSTTFPTLNFPGHILIIPLSHSPTLATIEADSRTTTRKEMHRYRHALQDMIATRSKDAAETHKLGTVTWSISRAGGVHLHWQFLPIERDTIAKGLVEAAFKVQAENEGYPRFEKTRTIQRSNGAEDTEEEERQDYFRVWIAGCEEAGDGEEKVMTLYLDAGFRFDLQFARKVLAKLMGLESRGDWRNCGQAVEEEEKDAEGFKEGFKGWDFTLEDD
ncbi:CwfJ C-terminus 1-domain-containing protein-like protein [Elsinoe ampelina]|uniref:CwfJ C-terminus 1-domain-containing protein-like protein n=1 Tax=Elsinoe ampelina TaxID=302913 RepID=A0A6A6GPS8_9PEZI|nr:CwfJ C-terminus 1-domain-containing protein-like protein [Elsinoe ampelina]